MTSAPLVTPAPPAAPADPAAAGDRRLISIASPCYNEAAVIDLFYGELRRVIDGLPEYDFELILVDDGSADRTLEALNRLAAQDGRMPAQRQLHLRYSSVVDAEDPMSTPSPCGPSDAPCGPPGASPSAPPPFPPPPHTPPATPSAPALAPTPARAPASPSSRC